MKKHIVKFGHFMKKHILAIVIGAVIGGLIIGSITTAAAYYTFTGTNVYYNNSNSGGSSSSVSGALDDLYSKISYGNATTSQIVSGRTALINGKKVTGSMNNNGAVSRSLSPGQTYYIPEGYHNGSGYVTATSLSGGYTIDSNGQYTISSLGYPSTIYVDVPAQIVKIKDLPYKEFDSQYVGAYTTKYVKTVSQLDDNQDDIITYPDWTGGNLYALSGTKKTDDVTNDVYYKGSLDDGESGKTEESHFEVTFSTAKESSNKRWIDDKDYTTFPRLNNNSLYKAKAVKVKLSCYKDATTYLKSEQGEEYFYGIAGTTIPEDINITILKDPNSYNVKSVVSNYDGDYELSKITAGSGTITYQTTYYSNYWDAYINTLGGDIVLELSYYAPNIVSKKTRGYCGSFKTMADYTVSDNCSNSAETVGLYDYYSNDKQDDAYYKAKTTNTFTASKNVIKGTTGHKFIYAEIRYLTN